MSFLSHGWLCVGQSLTTGASVMTAFTPTPTITVTMYRLQKNGAYYSTVQAQAIAARTYTYSRAWGRDNSNNYQVFVPYYYDSLIPALRQPPLTTLA